MYCRKEMIKILKCYLIAKKSYGTLFKGAIFFGQPYIITAKQQVKNRRENIVEQSRAGLGEVHRNKIPTKI